MIDLTTEQKLTIAEAAAFMQVKSETVHQWIKSGLRHLRYSQKVVFTSVEALQEFGESKSVKKAVRPSTRKKSQQNDLAARAARHGIKLKTG